MAEPPGIRPQASDPLGDAVVDANDSDPGEREAEEGQGPMASSNDTENNDTPPSTVKMISVSELVYAVESFNVIYKPSECSSERQG